jgi:hypothetical protein
MPDKKCDLPAMPFYIGDWKKDPAVQILNREDKMIWLELIFLMWESKERGYLTVNNKPMTTEMIAIALNLDNQTTTKRLTSFADIGLFSRRESDGAIYCRKIVNIVELSNKRKNAGKQGGNPNLVNQDLTKNGVRGYPNAETENENINEINNDFKKDSETIKDSQPTVETLAEDDEEIEGVKYFFGIFNINLDGSSEDLRKTWRRWVNRNHIRGKPIDKITATSQIKYLRTVEGGTAKIIEKINLSITNGWNGLNYESENNGKSEQKSSGATNDFLTNLCTARAVREYQNKPD